MKFNDKLKYLRESKGFTQEEIATKLNVARQSVSKWETGINEPDFDTLKKLCLILDCTISELIDDDNEIVSTKDIKKEKRVKWLLYWSIILFFMSLLSMIGFIRIMNDEIIMHWNFNNQVTRYGSKYEALIVLLPAFIVIIMNFVMFAYCKKSEFYKKYKVHVQLTGFIMQLVVTIIEYVFLFLADKYSIEQYETIFVIIMLSFLTPLMIFTHPKFNKRNLFFGLKTNFTLSNEKAWNILNAFGSILFLVLAFISYILVLIFPNKEYTKMFVLIPVFAIIPLLIYHEILRKRKKS